MLAYTGGLTELVFTDVGMPTKGAKKYKEDYDLEKLNIELEYAKKELEAAKQLKIRLDKDQQTLQMETRAGSDENAAEKIERGKLQRDNVLTYLEGNGEANELYNAMTDAEKKTYHYWWGEDPTGQKAREYMILKEHIFNERINKKKLEEAYKYATENPVEAAFKSFAKPHAGVSTMIGALEDAFLGAIGLEQVYDPYAADQMPMRMKNAYREGSMANLGTVGRFFAEAGYSMGDVITAMPLGPQMSLAVLGTNAAGDKFQSVMDNGGTLSQALASGIISGAIEIVTEKIGIDNLFDMIGKPSASIAKSLAKQMGAEAGEEGISAYANFLSDLAILGKNSEFSRYKEQLIAMGMSVEEATKQAAIEFLVKQPFMSMLGGAFSGAAMGGTFSTINKAANLLIDGADALSDTGKFRSYTDSKRTQGTVLCVLVFLHTL